MDSGSLDLQTNKLLLSSRFSSTATPKRARSGRACITSLEPSSAVLQMIFVRLQLIEILVVRGRLRATPTRRTGATPPVAQKRRLPVAPVRPKYLKLVSK